MLVVRELTEDLYAAIEHEIVPGVVQSIKVVTEAACRRFFRFAFDWARTPGRKTVHCVHKANILKLADGLFLEAFRAVGQGLPGADDRRRSSSTIAACRWCRGRSSSTCMVMGNLYGDIVSDLGAGMVGGISATAGINVGDGVRVYECFHGGSREAIRRRPGQSAAAVAAGRSTCWNGVGQDEAGPADLCRPWRRCFSDGKVRTPDLGGDRDHDGDGRRHRRGTAIARARCVPQITQPETTRAAFRHLTPFRSRGVHFLTGTPCAVKLATRHQGSRTEASARVASSPSESDHA